LRCGADRGIQRPLLLLLAYRAGKTPTTA
jgi:hypothetical protein